MTTFLVGLVVFVVMSALMEPVTRAVEALGEALGRAVTSLSDALEARPVPVLVAVFAVLLAAFLLPP